MIKIIFLDFDGVINTLQIDNVPFDTVTGKINHNGFFFNIYSPNDMKVSNRQAIMWLNKLCLETDAQIVIISTWRFDYDNAVAALYNSGLDKNIKIIGKTPYISLENRGLEINTFIENNLKNQEIKYVILDDDQDVSLEQKRHLVLCNTYNGFGFNEYNRAKNILN